LKDAASSCVIEGISKLPDCPFCVFSFTPVYKDKIITIAKPNGKFAAFLNNHHNQELNLDYLEFKFKEFLTKNLFSFKVKLENLNGHFFLTQASS